jgi:hypothetical protein
MSRTWPLAVALALLVPAHVWSQPAPPASASKPAAPSDEEEVDDDAGKPAAGELDLDKAPFTEAQKKFLKAWGEELKKRALMQATPSKEAAPKTLSLGWRAEIYTKIMYQNDQSQGSVSYGTPHPRGDNYTGNNGFASEINLYVDGKVSNKVEAGARIASRFHRQWGDFYENGDLARDSSGLPSGVDATGESLGMNHAAYLQLRGLYLRLNSPPIPSVKAIHLGSSDLAMFNPWTIGKVRYIDRDNAGGIFLEGGLGNLSYTLTRISLPKLYASAGWNSGIDDPLVQNPFWTRDATYALKLQQQPKDWLTWTFITSYLLDEEADLNDPDTLGSTNFIDKKDGVVATLPRYQNLNSTLEVQIQKGKLDGNLLAGFSYSRPDLGYVFNSVDGNQGISPIAMKTASSYAVKARIDLNGLANGFDLRMEYFNIGEDWTSTFGARREQDVLLTDGFLDGQLPTLNIANEFIDFRDPFYESIVGWHGGTIAPKLTKGSLEAELEFTFLEYNTDKQDRCTGNAITDKDGNPIASQVCPQDPATGKYYGVYPTFLYPDGMTDTEFFSYANTNDRGRDPRSVYRQNQARRTFITMARLAYQFDVGRGLKWDTKVKYIRDTDMRSTQVAEDDYAGNLLFAKTQASMQLTDELSASLGFKFAYWDEKHRSGAIVAGKPDYPDYKTLKTNLFYELKYQFGGATLAWYMEWLNKDVSVARAGVKDERTSYAYKNVVRGIGTIQANF